MLLGTSSNEQQQQLENGSSGMHVDGGGCDGGVQLKKGPWTAGEDAVLTEYVRKHGEGNWNAVQRNTGLARCGKSCRLRWANHLRPNLKKGAFSPEEERLIVELHAQLGNKWARMAAQLPGRTDNEIKNYWNTRVKRRHRQGLPLYPPEVQPQHKHQQLSHPQSSQSHHSYHSTPSTPTTPNSSFSFHTTATTPNTPTTHHHHSHHHSFPPPCYSRSTTPNSLSPTPPNLSPSLQSPTFPTLSLFDSTNANANNNANSNANANSPFNTPRTPPILQNPIRFKRFHSEPNNINATPNITSFNNNIDNSDNISCSNYQSSNFSLPFAPQFLRSSSSPILNIPQTNNNSHNHNTNNNNFFTSTSNATLLSLPSFSSLPVNFNTPNSSLFRTPVEKDCIFTSGSGTFSLKPELPSSQSLTSHNGNAEINFDNEKLSVSSSGSGLLEDLLEEAQAMASNYGDSSRRLSVMGSLEDQNKREFVGFNQWNDSNSLNISSGMKPKEETEGQINNMHEDLSKLLNVIPSMQPPEWYNDSGEASNCQSSVVTDDNIGLEMQQIASLFRVDSTTGHVTSNPGSCSFDNLPGIC